jgi:hypothetical protein
LDNKYGCGSYYHTAQGAKVSFNNVVVVAAYFAMKIIRINAALKFLV